MVKTINITYLIETLQTLRSTNSSILNTQDIGEITLDLDHDLDIKSKLAIYLEAFKQTWYN